MINSAMMDRYPITKRQYLHHVSSIQFRVSSDSRVSNFQCTVMNVLFTRSLAKHLPPTSRLIVNCLTPGLCLSELGRSVPFWMVPLVKLIMVLFARTTVEGAKTYVWAALAGKARDQNALRENLRGAFTMDCEIAEPSNYVLSKEGQEAETRLWVSVIEQYVETAYDVLINCIRMRRWRSSTRQILVREISFQGSSRRDCQVC
jgi:hypothetical protein